MEIEKVKDKLRRLIELNPERDFGYIHEPLTEEQITDFEAAHNIRLPEDYRTFLTTMFNGGVGPEQIMPLDFWDSVHNAVYLDSIGNKLSAPFLLEQEWERHYDDKNYKYAEMINGTIRLCHIGCGNFLILVVNGNEYGNIWIDDRASSDSIVPFNITGINTRITFDIWYNHWLDSRIIYFEKEKAMEINNQKLRVEAKKVKDELNAKSKDIEPDPFYEDPKANDIWAKIKKWISAQ